MGRYVILSHDHPYQHWDLMLESGDHLRTWRLGAPPSTGMGIAAEGLGDHRLDYLEYEGPVSGGRGTVSRWDRGSFTWIEDGENIVEVELRGERLLGRLKLAHGDGQNWICLFDEYREA